MNTAPRCRVLLVEDHDDTREFTTMLLEREGYDVRMARTTEEARSFIGGTWQPDVIVSDVFMSTESGLDFVRWVRAQPGLAKVPAIAVSAGVRAADRDACFRAGFQMFLPKPVDPSELVAAVLKLC